MKICPECKSLLQDAANACSQCGNKVSAEDVVDGDRLAGVKLNPKYELVECVGEGAMGWVYRAVHTQLDSSVAVKIMKPKDNPDEFRAERFKQEARTASRLNHPNIVSVIDFGETSSGFLYLVTEFLQGKLLSQVIDSEAPLESTRALRIMDQLLAALQEIHHAGLIHRDLKPDNLMISALGGGGEEFVRVLDFGIVKQLAGNEQKLTQHGQLFGTPNYMAPEQVRSQEVTAAADLYASGVILYEMLTGRVPFDSEILFDVLQAHLYEEPPRLSEANPEQEYPADLQAVVDRALNKKPGERFEDAASFRNALREAFRKASSEVCKSCGGRAARGARFCPVCGNPMEGAVRPRSSIGAGTAETLFASSIGNGGTLDPAAHSPVATARLRSVSSMTLPFAERSDELCTVDEVVRGNIPLLYVVGGSGMGKTVLARKAVRSSLKAGLAVVWVEPHRSQVTIPWWPVRSAVGQVLGIGLMPSVDGLKRALGDRKDLEHDLPGLLELFGLYGPLHAAAAEVRKNEVMAAAVRACVLGTTKPCLLIFEDADLYDEPSLSFLQILARKVGGAKARLLVTATLPVVDLDPSAKTVDLPPLDSKTVGGMIRLTAGKSVDGYKASLDKLVVSAKGNPMRVQLMLGMGSSYDPEAGVSLSALIAGRVDRLPDEARRIVQAVSVLGMEASETDVAELLEIRSLNGERVDLLRVQGILEESDGIYGSSQKGDPHVSFVRILRLSHPAIVSSVREIIDPELKRKLAFKALSVLEKAGAPEPVLAHHALDAGLDEKAVKLLVQAGEEAMRVSDHTGAVQLFRTAVDVARTRLFLNEEDPQFAAINMKLGTALRQAGDLNTAQMVLKSASAMRGGTGAQTASLRHELARVVWAQGHPMKATHLMYQAIGDAIVSGDAGLIIRVYLDLSRLLESTGDPHTAMHELGEAVDLVTHGQGPDTTEGPEDLWKLFSRMAELMRDTVPGEDGAGAALIWSSYSLSHAGRADSVEGLARSNLLMADLTRRLDDPDQAAMCFDNALRYYKQAGDRAGQAVCLEGVAGISPEGGEKFRQKARGLGEELAL